ncbi:MAG: tripartite tricarboxylate transporter permease [Devosia sp.]
MVDLASGFAALFNDGSALFFVFLGAIVGTLIGAIPGLTTPAAIAMLLPITGYMSPLAALAFLYVIGKAGRFGGSIAAILFNTPGTTAAAATGIDGHPLARQGKSGKALKVATIASVCGDTVGELILIFGAVFIASYTILLGPPEYFAIYVTAFVIIGSVVGKSIVRGLASAAFGVLLAMVGLDVISGTDRYVFGNVAMMGGFSLVPLLVGAFVVSEILVQAEAAARGLASEKVVGTASGKVDRSLSWGEFLICAPVIVRSSGIGALIGLMPGLGSAVACFIAYGEEKRRARRPELWGKGAVEGVAAPEAANNAVSGPSMIPVLTLGIPGSTIAAILIGVFLIHGIQVGPTIFLTSRDLVFGLFAAGLIGIASYGLIGWFGAPLIGRLIGHVPQRLIYPTILLMTVVAVYSLRSSLFDVSVMFVFGLVGYGMRKLDFSPPAMIISFVLARGAEEALQQSLMMSSSGYLIFFERPAALAFLLIGLAGFSLRLRQFLKERRRSAPGPARPADDVDTATLNRPAHAEDPPSPASGEKP